ncbi:MAG: hypothetical protein Ta2C_06040 [Candidatus Endomicrobiellum trichonymphae]|nr:MAG: hypothetical protein Ta2C_06040 [Candidatus Endomicrobium trichonymphae]
MQKTIPNANRHMPIGQPSMGGQMRPPMRQLPIQPNVVPPQGKILQAT